MSKETVKYVCKECGFETRRKAYSCSKCESFNSFEEVVERNEGEIKTAGLKSSTAITPSKNAFTISELSSNPIDRTATGINELDRVLGGGFVDAEVVLLGGAPGAGKSSLSLSIADAYASLGKKVLYSSGEESEQQIGLRADRMKISNDLIKVTHETNLETLLGHIEREQPDMLIVDSLQTIASKEIPGSIGSVSQSKEASHTLTRIAKEQGITMVLINQIIKSGEFSGSESIQHIVDCALFLDSDKNTPLKFLRATKNRFGDTTEVGVFQHEENGLMEVSDPSGIFLENYENAEITGASCAFVSEGVRQLPVEIQALVSRSTLPTPRKQFNGVDYKRGQIVCAILDKYCRTKLFDKDVFVSTVSGIMVKDPQADLSMAASILSSDKDMGFEKTAFVGELSLTGQVRGSFMIENKVREASRLGFEKIVVPTSSKIKKVSDIQIVRVSNIKDIVKLLKD